MWPMKIKIPAIVFLSILFLIPASSEELSIQELIDDAKNKLEESPEDAVEILEGAIKEDPSNKEVHYLRGVALAKLGNYTCAVESFDEALCRDDRYVDALYGKAAACAHLRRCDDAKRCYDIIDDEKLDSISRLNNERGLFTKNCGLLGFDGSPVGAEPAAEDRQMIAIYEDAIKSYDESIEADENYTFSWNNKGVALGDLGRYGDAMECFNRATEMNDSFAEAWNNKGVTLDYMGEHQEALDCYNRSIGIDPLLADAWFNKGNNLARYTDRYQDGKACYNKSIEIKPELEKELKRHLYVETSERGWNFNHGW